MKKQSAETELRYARRDLRDLRALNAQITNREKHYRERATKAEQEVAEWKRRFDALLKIVPESPDRCVRK